jgi:IS30 family transposase
MYLADIITLPVINQSKEISSLLVDYEEKGLSLRQIAAKKVHSRSTIQKNLKRADVRLRAPGQNYGNPSQLKFGYRKEAGKVILHHGEQMVIAAIKDFRAEGMTLRQIAQRMSVFRIPSKNGKTKWHPMMVKRIVDGF